MVPDLKLGANPDLKELARKELDRMKKVLPFVKIIRETDNGGADDILGLANAYYSDGEHFFREGKFVEAFEAAIIAWGYIDSGLHLQVFEVPSELKGIFTV